MSKIERGDVDALHRAFQGTVHERRREHCEERVQACAVDGLYAGWLARVEGRVVGHIYVLPDSVYGPLRARRIPEIHDLTVHPDVRRCGVASALMDCAEAYARSLEADCVGLGVGLHPGYNAAHALYGRRGYVLDGSGVYWNHTPVQERQMVCMDDGLVLFLIKSLRGV